MRFLFIIHSNITLILFLLIKNFLGLKDEQIVVFNFRGFKHPFLKNFHCVELSKNIITPASIFDFVRIGELLKWVDDTIEKEVSSQYKVFLPHVRNLVYQAIVTNPSCKGFSYIEEGELTYQNFQRGRPLKNALINFINPRIFGGLKSFWPGYQQLYGLSVGAFPWADSPSKRIFELNDLIVLGYKQQLIGPVSVIVFDAGDLFGLYSFRDVTHQFWQKISVEIPFGNILYFKLHPAHAQKPELLLEHQKVVQAIFGSLYKVQFLVPEIILELEFQMNKTIVLYFVQSTLGRYAKVFGLKATSILENLDRPNK
jgi:hypothetical protein